MVISHNLPAINAHRLLQKNTRGLNKTLQRLSTGLRIAKAADDAAGLAISEKMRAQIKGLRQATRNAQDGISLIQTADGAMNEMSAILNRMRELSVQGANDVNTSEDRNAIQREIDQLQDEINRISNTTEFNGKKLLSGDMAALTSTDDLRTKVQVNGSLAKPDGGSAEGNYELEIMARPPGEAQVQKSAQMKVIKDLSFGEESEVEETEPTPPTPGNAEDVRVIFSKTFGGSLNDTANFINKTADGGYIIGGSSFSSDGDVPKNEGSEDYWIFKTDADGNIEWSTALGGSNIDYVNSVKQTSDGNYVAIGTSLSPASGDVTSPNGSNDMWVVKLDASGGVIWENSYGTADANYGIDIIETSDGGFAIGGTTYLGSGVGGNREDYHLIKTDAAGVVQWEQTYGGAHWMGGNGWEYLSGLMENSDGTFSLIGTSASDNGDVTGHHGPDLGDVWYLKVDAAGNIDSNFCFGGLSTEWGLDMIPTSDGNYLITGGSRSSDFDVSGNYGWYDYWALKIDPAGNILWEQNYGGTSSEISFAVKETSDGDFIFYGESLSDDVDVSGNNGSYDLWVVKTDSDGNLLWEKNVGGSGKDSLPRSSPWPAYDKVDFVDEGNGEYTFVATTASTDGDVDTPSKGGTDVWMFRLSENPPAPTPSPDPTPAGSFYTLTAGDLATEDVRLSNIDRFYDSNGNFILDPPKTIELEQGDGTRAKVTLSGGDTIGTLKGKLNSTIGDDLGQSRYVDASMADKFVSYVTNVDDSGLESVAGTFVVRSVIPGKEGEIHFNGDSQVLKALGFSTIKESEESVFVVDIADAHTGNTVVSGYSVSQSKLLGVIHENVNVDFSNMAGIGVSYDHESKSFTFEGGIDNLHETFVHIADRTHKLHVGANEKEEIAFTIGDMTLDSLGIEYISVANNDLANQSIGKIDLAAYKVTDQRGKLGALQNRLEKSINVAENATENLVSSESRIRDADMAKQAMILAKQQMLVQSAQSMLAQANQLSNSSYEAIRSMVGA